MESSDTSNSVEKRKPADLFKAYVEYMKLMLGNLFIINAGSATALIAFFGNIKPEGSASQLVTPVSVKNAVAFYAFASSRLLCSRPRYGGRGSSPTAAIGLPEYLPKHDTLRAIRCIGAVNPWG